MNAKEDFYKSFLMLCYNENFSDLREIEPVLKRVVKEIITVKPAVNLLNLKGIYLRRGAYILDMARRLGGIKNYDDILNEAKIKLNSDSESAGLSFLNKDKPLAPEYQLDEVAKYWGLSKGFAMQRLLQIMRYGYA